MHIFISILHSIVGVLCLCDFVSCDMKCLGTGINLVAYGNFCFDNLEQAIRPKGPLLVGGGGYDIVN